MMRLKVAGPFACCTAPAVDEFTVKDSASSHVAPAGAHALQQPGASGWWKVWRRQPPPQQPNAAASAAADIKQPQKQHKPKHHSSSQRHKLRHSLDGGALAAASGTAMQRSGLSSSCSVPLTSTSLSAAAIGCHSLSASAGVQAYQRAGGAIRHQDTGDSPSEIHSEFQQQKVLSSFGTSCERSGEAGGSMRSLPDSSDSKQQPEEQQQQHAGTVQSVPGSLSSVLLQEPLLQQFSSSNSCHATAASASVSDSSVHGAAADAAAAGTSTGTAAAAGVGTGTWQRAEAPAGPADSPVQPPRQLQQQQDLQLQHPQQQQDHFKQQLHHFQQQQQQQQANGMLPTLPSTASSSYLPLNYRLPRLESGRSFRMSDPQFASSSSNAEAVAVASPASAPAAGSGSSSGGAPSPFRKSATSPFAQLTLQQAVATTLMATRSLRQQLEQQQQQQPADHQHSMPTAGSAALSFASLSYSNSAAATGPGAFSHASSSGSFGTGPAAAAGSSSPLFSPGGVTPRSTRISWAASSTTLAPEPKIFEVLDPETSSTCSGHRILQPSASATSLSSMTSNGGSGSTAKEKLQQLRMAVSMGSFNRSNSAAATAAAAVADADAAAAAGSSSSNAAASSSNAAASSSNRFRSILRRSTALSAVDTKSNGSDTGRCSLQQRRSRSAHVSVIEPQHMSAAGEAVSGSLADQAGCGTAGSSRSLPPLPPTSSSAAAAAAGGSPGPGSVARKGTAAAVCGSTVSSFSSSSASTATMTGLLSAASSYGRQLPHSASMAALETQSTGGSSVTSLVAGSSTGGSLVALAVNRMHVSQSAPALRGQSAGASGMLSSSGSFGGSELGARSISAPGAVGTAANGAGLPGQVSSGALSSLSSSSSSAGLLAPAGSSSLLSSGNSASSSCAVASAFADAFLAALAGGNTKWGSDATVSQLLHDAAKMMGMDKQLYVGKVAIIRRLNSGMDQLVKMVAANAVDSSGEGGSSSNPTAVAELVSNMPKPLLSVTCPDPKAKPSLVVAQYTFKWGLRKFTLRDEFIVKNSQIMRLRRSRG